MDTSSPFAASSAAPSGRNAAGRGAAMQRVVDRLKPAADKILLASLPALSRGAIDALDRDADSSRDAARIARECRVILAEEAAFSGDFFVAFDRAVAAAVAEFGGSAPAPRPKLGLAALSLVEFDQMEETMVVDRMGARLRNAVDEHFSLLNQRLANVLRAPKLGDRDNPFHPMRFASALGAAIDGRKLQGEACISLLKGFEQVLREPLDQIYEEMNLRLAAEGVSDIADPELLRHTMIGARAAQAKRGWATTLAGQVHFEGAPALPDVPSVAGAHAEQLLQVLYQRLHVGNLFGGAAALPAGSMIGATPAVATRVPFGQVEPIMAAPPPLAPGMTFAAGAVEVDPQLLAAIGEKQLAVARAWHAAPAADAATGAADEAAAQRADLIERATRQIDKLTIEIVGLVFERMHGDKHLPGEIKSLLARLQFPFLRAALTEPDLFVSSEAPARRLIDRIASTAIGWEPEGLDNQRYLAEVERAVELVVQANDDVAAAFKSAIEGFDAFLAAERTRDDDPVQRAKRALEEVENREVMAINAAIGVRRAFEGVLLESYLRDFLLGIWVRVLVAATLRARSEPGFEQRFKDVVPDLVWSVQPKFTQDERRRLVTVIPRTLSALRAGLALVEWPQSRITEFFGRLMASHANAVKALELAHGVQPPIVDPAVLRERLAAVSIGLPPDEEFLGEVEIEPELVRREIERSNAELSVLAPASGPVDVTIPAAHFSDHEIDAILEGWQRGDWFELRVADTDARVRLRWISPRRSFYLFADAKTGAAHSLSPEVARSYVRSGRLRPVESRPLFERMVGAIMQELGGKSS